MTHTRTPIGFCKDRSLAMARSMAGLLSKCAATAHIATIQDPTGAKVGVISACCSFLTFRTHAESEISRCYWPQGHLLDSLESLEPGVFLAEQSEDCSHHRIAARNSRAAAKLGGRCHA